MSGGKNNLTPSSYLLPSRFMIFIAYSLFVAIMTFLSTALQVTYLLGSVIASHIPRHLESNNRVQVICYDTKSGEAQRIYQTFQRLEGHIWRPRIIGMFTRLNTYVPSRKQETCIASMRTQQRLGDFAEGLSYSDVREAVLGKIGMRMLTIVRGLHEAHLKYPGAVSTFWGLLEPEDINSLTMVYPRMIVESWNYMNGYHNIQELQQLALTLRYLLYRDLYSLRQIQGTEFRDVPLNAKRPPPGLVAVLEYVFSIDAHRGSFPAEMYSVMESIFQAMILSDRSLGMQRSRPPYAIFYHTADTCLVESGFDTFLDIEIVGTVAIGDYGFIYEAVSRTDPTLPKPFAVKCRTPSSNIQFEAWVLSRIATATWAPQVYGTFDILTVANERLTCLRMERLGMNLEEFVKLGGLNSVETVLVLVKQMFTVIEELHNQFGFIHHHLPLHQWLLRNNDLANLVLVDYAASGIVGGDHSGSERRLELAQVVQTMEDLFQLQQSVAGIATHEGDSTLQRLIQTLKVYLASVEDSIYDQTQRFVNINVYAGIRQIIDEAALLEVA